MWDLLFVFTTVFFKSVACNQSTFMHSILQNVVFMIVLLAYPYIYVCQTITFPDLSRRERNDEPRRTTA